MPISLSMNNILKICIIEGKPCEPWIHTETNREGKMLLVDFIESGRLPVYKSPNKVKFLRDIKILTEDGPISAMTIFKLFYESEENILVKLDNYSNLLVREKMEFCEKFIPGYCDKDIHKISLLYDIYLSISKYWEYLFDTTPTV